MTRIHRSYPCNRVGRTGRAGDKDGTAYTLLEAGRNAHFAGQLVQSLTLVGQEVPRPLYALAMKVRGRSRWGGAVTLPRLCRGRECRSCRTCSAVLFASL
jgi:superfamily II DNA/RNA helicase